jgi:hypothetical protein
MKKKKKNKKNKKSEVGDSTYLRTDLADTAFVFRPSVVVGHRAGGIVGGSAYYVERSSQRET